MRKLFKSFVFAMLIIIGIVCLSPVIAFAADGDASIWSVIFTRENIGEIIAVISLILLSVIAPKFKQLITEITEALQTYNKAKSEDSPGGKNVTAKEKALIYKETLDVIQSAIGLIWKRGLTKPVYWIFQLLKKILSKK